MKHVVVVLLLLTLQAQSSSDATPTSRIHFTALDCRAKTDDGSNARLTVFNLAEHHYEAGVQYDVSRTALGVKGNLYLRPGFYDVMLDLHDGCEHDTLLPVLARQDQDILFVGLHGMYLRDFAAMMAGTAPFTGYSASIVYWPQEQHGNGPKTLVVVPARVQGVAFYAPLLGSGTVRLRITTSDAWGGTDYMEFKVGRIGDRGRRFVTFNVSQQDVLNARDYPLPVGSESQSRFTRAAISAASKR